MKTKSYLYGVERLNGYDAWALFKACASGDLANVRSLLAKDPRLVNAQYWYQFPIHLAVRAGHDEIVELLLKENADPGQSRFTYNSWDKLLLDAAERGYRKVEAVLRRAMRKRFGYTPDFEVLKQSILSRDARRIGAVLRRHPRLAHASDALGNNALHWSVLTRQLHLLDRFAELGTPLDALRADGQTPTLLAVRGTDYWYRDARGKSHPSLRNQWVMVGALLAKGASYSISVAAAVGDQERVEQLLRQDAGLARRLDSARRRPLAYAAVAGHAHIVRLLLEWGAEPNAPEDLAPDGLALYEACCRNDFEMAKLLLEHGANPNAGVDSSECCLTIGRVYHGGKAKRLQDLLRRYGAYTPPYRLNARQMKQAIRGGHPVIRHEEFFGNVLRKRDPELLELYLDSNPGVSRRMSFSDGAAYPGSPALLARLLARGLDPNRPDWLGKTFLHACAENGDRSSVALLLKAGADINARDLQFKGTPLAAAIRSCSGDNNDGKRERQVRMVEFLLKRDAATNLPGDEPWATPLAWAIRGGHDQITQLLKQHGAR
jgi:ankyrin repeat protein